MLFPLIILAKYIQRKILPSLYACIYVSVWVHVCMSVGGGGTCMCFCGGYVCVCLCGYMYVCMCVEVHVCVCVCRFMYICLYVGVHVCVSIGGYMYVCLCVGYM